MLKSPVTMAHRIKRFWKTCQYSPWLLPALVFLLALLPRVLSLDAFLTADEDDQLEFAVNFLLAIRRRDWGGALVLGYPGVPTMALGSLGLWLKYSLLQFSWPPFFSQMNLAWVADNQLAHQIYMPLVMTTPAPPITPITLEDMLATVKHQPLAFIQAVRLPLAVMSSFIVTMIFVALRRLVNPQLALLATLLISFEPIFLANSRVIHVDAPLAYFMFASFVAFLVYLRHGQWGWLAASGLLGGLALLSKTPAATLGPILVGGGALYAFYSPPFDARKAHLKRLVLALTGWGIIAVVAFFLLWPSMWARPGFALNWIIGTVKMAFNISHPTSGNFWGRLVTDQSPWYYLVALPFHLTPLVSLGVILAGVMSAYSYRQSDNATKTAIIQRPFALALWIYFLVFLVAVSIVSRRGVRYLLPIFPALDCLAALGLWWVIAEVKRTWFKQGVIALAGVQLTLILAFHPYYFDYVNPLLGGYRTAPYHVVLGWGEGLDQAAAYLNQKPAAETLWVTAWYSRQFAPYFKGFTEDLSSNEAAYTADYTIFYLNQKQRRFPSQELLHYFADRQPEKVITLGGIEYAWIYPGPIIGHEPPTDLTHPLNVNFNETLLLLGFDLRGLCEAGCQPTPITLYWQTLAEPPRNLNVSLRIVDETGLIWGQVDRLPVGGLIRSHKWQPGDIIRDEYMLTPDPALPPGAYSLEILVYDFKTGDLFGSVDQIGHFTVQPTSVLANQKHLVIPHPLQARLAPKLFLIGHTYEPLTTLAGYEQTVKLYWQTSHTLALDYAISLLAQAPDGSVIPLLTEGIGAATYPTSKWPAGQTVAQAVTFQVPPDAPAGAYQLVARLGENEANLGTLTVQAQDRTYDLPADITPVATQFGSAGEIALRGYTHQETADGLDLTLYWQPNDLLNQDYKVFIHLADDTGTIVAQRDAIPATGSRPTSTWLPPEIISDSYHLPPPPERYTIWLGLYQPETGQRLPVVGDRAVSEDRLQLLAVEGEGE